ncbi:pyridoxal-phosphate dependent enzyme [Microbacterium sp. RD1]|uniref:pyridoxal-phosphate dependent enzyme n=1 Tax=Microbacterium sp. RD1 TaxID=3457313 RepID=UPI003FA53EDF
MTALPGAGGMTLEAAQPGIWRYSEALGLAPELAWLSLGESMTPVVRDPRLAGELGLGDVVLKLDSLCPTGSFKDRLVAAGVARAVADGASGIVCASSGNAAASTAAYGARAGLPVILVMPANTPPGKISASAAYGSRVLLVTGDYSESFRVAAEIARTQNLVNVTTTYVNPHGVDALRSVAFDLHGQLDDTPDAIVVPTSAGPLVHGVVAGYEDLRARGLVGRIPRVIAAQPAGCSPVARAFEAGDEEVREWETVTTTVSGLDDPLRGYAGDGTRTLRALRRSGGVAVAVEDAVADEARAALARRAGVYAEPAGSLGVAALPALARSGAVARGERVVCLITGNGMKRPLTPDAEPVRAESADEALAIAAQWVE